MKTNRDLIIIIGLFIISIMNGCQTCNLKNTIISNQKTYQKSLELQAKSFEEQQRLLIKEIEYNAAMVIILEKEIDEKNIKSSEIKQLIDIYKK